MDAAVARVLFFAIIIVIVVATILLYHVHRKLAGRGHRKALGWLVDPMPIKPYIRGRGNARGQGTAATGSPPRSLARGVKVVLAQTGWRMLFFVILAVIVLVAAEVSIFFHECGHGLVGELVGGSWTQIRIGLLNGTSWTPMSLVESDGEPYFIARSWVVLMGNGMEVIVSTGFLLLLLVPPVRKSFIASLFVLALGAAIHPRRLSRPALFFAAVAAVLLALVYSAPPLTWLSRVPPFSISGNQKFAMRHV